MRVAHAGMVAVFALCAFVQLNDPDPLRWIAMYVAALVVAALGAAGRPDPWLAGIVATIALGWAGSQADAFVTCLGAGHTCFSSWDMHDDAIAEEAREAGGLLIAAAWSIVALADSLWRRRSRPDATAASGHRAP